MTENRTIAYLQPVGNCPLDPTFYHSAYIVISLFASYPSPIELVLKTLRTIYSSLKGRRLALRAGKNLSVSASIERSGLRQS